MSVNWSRLAEPFPAEDVEWRLARAGTTNAGDFWGLALAYITARAIQERLDEVFGVAGWKNEYRTGPNGGVVCRIYFRDEQGEWVWREDGADNTDVEAVKGGISGALKRAGAALGIGRYLYHLEEGWATCYRDQKQGRYRGKTKDDQKFSWDPPALPAWALPGGSGRPEPGTERVDTRTGEVQGEPAATGAPQPTAPKDAPTCPKCGGPVWDNRQNKRSPKTPDWSCKDKDGCKWALWLDSTKQRLREELDRMALAGIIQPASVAHVMQGIADGDLGSLHAAQDWVNAKLEEAKAKGAEAA